MKHTYLAFMLFAAASVALILGERVPTFAQSQVSFNIGDRIEANITSIVGGAYEQGWRKATITRVFEARNKGSNAQKELMIVAVADAVSSRGTTYTVEASRLAELNIPYSKNVPLAVKAITRTTQTPQGHELVKGITVLVTNKRYVIYTRGLGGSIYAQAQALAVDETGALVGSRHEWGRDTYDWCEGCAETLAGYEHVLWANLLIPELLATAGVWQGKVSYRVKTDEGQEYTLVEKNLRRLTEAKK